MTDLPLPACSKLRLMGDRVAWAIFQFGVQRPVDVIGKPVALLVALAYMSGPAMTLLLLFGLAFDGVPGWGWGATAAGWAFYWLFNPLVRGTNMRPLGKEEYAHIEAMAEPSWQPTLARWARTTPRLDMRHLLACEAAYARSNRGQIVPTHAPFGGQDARDLFQGQIGRMAQAQQEGHALEATTPTTQSTTPLPPRRL